MNTSNREDSRVQQIGLPMTPKPEESEVTRYMATRGVLGKSAPAAAQLINKIALRFGVPVTQKVAFQAVPVIGALSGASLNLLFTQYFQNIAKVHFSIRRLERRFGREVVREVYQHVLLEKERTW
jgi:hypothetical protein